MWVFFAVVLLVGHTEPTMYSYNNWERMGEARCAIVAAREVETFDPEMGVLQEHGCAKLASHEVYDRNSA